MNHQSGDIETLQQIDAYVKGQLSEEKTEELWIKLLKNPTYLEYLETEIAVKSILEERQGSTGNGGGTFISELGRSWKWMAAAASVAILVIAINFLQLEGPVSLQEETIGSINMTNNLAAPMVMRSQKSELSGADSLMNVGFEAALSGDLTKAIEMYENVTRRYEDTPAAAEAHLNIGIIKYNSGDYKEASSAFQQALSKVQEDEVLEEKAYWYLGNAFINIDQLEKAREAVHSAYALGGTYRKPAFRLLRKLDYELGNINSGNFEQQMNEN